MCFAGGKRKISLSGQLWKLEIANCHQKVIFGDNLLFRRVLYRMTKENGGGVRLPIYG